MAKRTVLYIEDDDAAFFLFQLAIKEMSLEAQVYRAWNGDEAMALLRNAEPSHSIPRPELILLDLNLPGKSGFEILSEIKASESFRSIPVIIFSSSTRASDRDRSLALGAESFVTKPSSMELFLAAVRSAFAEPPLH